MAPAVRCSSGNDRLRSRASTCFRQDQARIAPRAAFGSALLLTSEVERAQAEFLAGKFCLLRRHRLLFFDSR